MTGPVPTRMAEVADAALEVSVVGSFSRLGYAARRRLFRWEESPRNAMRGRTALVTGATSGLGLATALGLAGAGADVIVLGRDRERTGAARAQVEAATGRAAPEPVVADLTRLADVRRAATALSANTDRLDILVHNAGALVHDLERTVDGLEVTVQTHVVSPFLLTALLYPQLAGRDARVITVTSGGMYSTGLHLDLLEHAPDGDDFDGVQAYARAKRAQVVLTEQWAARSRDAGITFHAMHPGWVDTAGLKASLPRFRHVVRPLLRTADQGVDTTLWLARADEPRARNGALWLDRRPRRTVYLPGTSTSDVDADRLWAWCGNRSGVDDPTVATTTRPGATG